MTTYHLSRAYSSSSILSIRIINASIVALLLLVLCIDSKYRPAQVQAQEQEIHNNSNTTATTAKSSTNNGTLVASLLPLVDAKKAARRDDMLAMVASMGANSDLMSPALASANNADEVVGYQGEGGGEGGGEGETLLPTTTFDGRPLPAKRYDWHLKLDQANRYRLDWTVDYPANLIEFALSINLSASNFREGSDVFALGFSSYGQLNSSDFCLAWYDLSHRIHLQDARTDANYRLQLVDLSQSVCKLLPSNSAFSKQQQLFELEQNENSLAADQANKRGDKLQIHFERPLDVCQAKNLGDQKGGYYTIDNGTTHLVWFTLRGPLLSIDGLNLKELEQASNSAGAPLAGDKAHVTLISPVKTVTVPTAVLQNGLASSGGLPGLLGKQHSRSTTGDQMRQFESGMKRAQLIASRSAVTNRSKGTPTAGRLEEKRLLSHPSSSPSSKKSMMSLDIRMSQFKIPAQETTYWCKLFKLPHKFETKRYHITKYEAVIEKKNEHVVHHMELFHCANLNGQRESQLADLYNTGGWSGDCNGPKRPKATEPCRRVILAWAMGAHPLEYPEQAGQSIGGHNYSPYVLLEVHYNNVGSQAGLIDSSGLKFHYTSKLRQFDAGVMEIGLEYSDKVSIPPNLITPIAGHCASECTRVAMADLGQFGSQISDSVAKATESQSTAPATADERVSQEEENDNEIDSGDGGDDDEDDDHDDDHHHRIHHKSHNHHHHQHKHRAQLEAKHQQAAGEGGGGIYVFAAQMHTHLVGVASWTEHVRGGKLMGELQRDNHYSPHFQEIRILPEPVFIAPGDALIHYCLYDTTNRVNITLGGFAISDEMCVSYLHYYPRIDLEVCKSSVDTGALEAYFAYLAREEGQRTSVKLKELENEHNKENDDNSYYNYNIGGNDATSNNNTSQAGGGRNSKVENLKSVSENYKSIEWSRRRSEELIQFYSNAPISIQCNRSNGARFPGYWTGATPTKLWPQLKAGQKLADRVEQLTSVWPTGSELVGYRGREFGRRHAQCAQAH